MRKAFKVISVLLIASVFVLTSRVPPNQVVAATVSPTPTGGGGKIAFTSDRDGHHEIYTMDADGSNQGRLTFSKDGYGSLEPAWSSDGKQIAFTYGSGTTIQEDYSTIAQIYVMNADGSNQWRISKEDTIAWSPAWSPDGKYIAYIQLNGADTELCETASDGADPHCTNEYREVAGPDYLPDGKSIISYHGGLSSSDFLQIAQQEINSKRELSSIEYLDTFDSNNYLHSRLGISGLGDMNPAYSPDGKEIAFISTRENGLCSIGQRCIYLLNTASRQVTQIPVKKNSETDWLGFDPLLDHLSWSPDSKWITFTASSQSDGLGNLAIWTTTLDGTKLQSLTDSKSNNFQPAWQPIP